MPLSLVFIARFETDPPPISKSAGLLRPVESISVLPAPVAPAPTKLRSTVVLIPSL